MVFRNWRPWSSGKKS